MLEDMQRDDLTGLLLRGSFNSLLRETLKDAKRENKSFSIFIMDVDYFKKFNDKFGHLFGDEILKYVVSTLNLSMEGEGRIFRYGGDEFVAVFAGKSQKEVYHLLRVCRNNMKNRLCLFKNRFFRVKISCGIAGFPYDGETAGELLKKADEALYFSKRTGRNRTTLAGRIRHIKLHNLFKVAASICVFLLSLFLLYKFFFSDVVKDVVVQVRNVRIIAKPKDLDVIILKTGDVFEGYILTEIDDRIIFDLYIKQGEGRLEFKRSEIARIKYSQGLE